MKIIDIQSFRALRVYSQIRSLWTRRTGVRLPNDVEKHGNFCRDVLSFQIGRFSNHPLIYFGNISVLQLHVFPGRPKLVQKFTTIFKYLRIDDLCIYCATVPSFMDTALKFWAPSLQNLQILRIAFERFSFQVSGLL